HNRKNQTPAENLLWQNIRNNKLGIKVRRQHSVKGYIVDFALLEARLIVELDGEYHNEEQQRTYDDARTKFLNEFDLKLIRFTNEEVLNDISTVIEKIKAAIAEQKQNSGSNAGVPLLREEKGLGDEATSGVRVYTTRPDTIFGVDFMVLAPEHELVAEITTPEQKAAVEEYVAYVKSRSERERMAEKKISGCFTGAYAVNPLTGRDIPIWISEYVLAGYGTGAIMAVPSGDERDHKFARFFNIPVTNIFGDLYTGEEAIPDKNVTLYDSGFITGLKVKDAAEEVITWLEDNGIGERKVNYKMRDAAFSRQRYWGEPFPIVWKDGIAYPLKESELPLELPHVDSYKPGPEGEGPLANILSWADIPSSDGDPTGLRRETNTMPGYAGSSWYFLRYMDPHNDKAFCSRSASDYWNQVDLYIGGTEHAVGHLLYSRMWTKVLYDLGYIGFNEPFKRLVNQGMIQGSSRFVYRIRGTNSFVSFGLKEQYEFDEIHVDVNIVDGVELDITAFRNWRPEFENADFILENDKYICGTEVEKMSKSKFNTVNPDNLVNKYGADTFRMYEMFLGPVEQSKPWDTKGIEGVHRFLKKFWRLFYDEEKGQVWIEEQPAAEELKVLHRTIKKIEDDTERFSFNTAVSAFMIAVNELTDLGCRKKAILEKMLVLLTPYAPHIAEELWRKLGNSGSILDAVYPAFEEKYVTETSKSYPVAINGKTRTEINIALDATQQQVEAIVLADGIVQKWLEGKPPKKVIYVKNRMINVVM
ncbi:MAG: leucine--tRNA ligase, partial [Sphingobacteriales bacterium]|nr:leucine--tRNA ligase [Sphingobacteriales bacterium]